MQTFVQIIGWPAVQIFLGTLPLLGVLLVIAIQNDRRFAAIDKRLDRMDTRLDRMDDRFDRLEVKLDKILDKLSDLDKRVAVLEGGRLLR